MSIGRLLHNPTLRALRELGTSSEARGSIFERLSTGLRINRASDDPAGIGLADKLRSETRLHTQALRNINDGVSLLNVAQGALDAMAAVLTRQKELASAAASGSLTASQRQTLAKEADALTAELNRIIQSTRFQGQSLLTQPSSITLQTGAESSNTISFDLNSVLAGLVGSGSFAAPLSYTAGAGASALVTGDFNGDGIQDIATANQAGQNITVLLGNADGTFNRPRSFIPADAPIAIEAGDINGDGILDLVTADYGVSGLGGTASIFIGNGDGTFKVRTTVPTALGPSFIALADVNNDGALDPVSSVGATSFISGTSEVTSITLPTNGTTQVTAVNMAAIAQRETTSITTADIGIREVSTITAVDAASVESSTITAIATAYRERSSLTAIGTSMQEVSSVTVTSSSVAAGSYFLINSPSQSYHVWFTVDGAGADPGATANGIQVALTSSDTTDSIATKIAAAINGPAFTASAVGSAVTITNVVGGAAADIGTGTAGASVSVATTTQGTTSALQGGDHFLISSATSNYYVWFTVGGVGTDPSVGGRTGIRVDLGYGASASSVAASIAAALPAGEFSVTPSGATLAITNVRGGNVTDIGDGTVGGAFAASVTSQGVNSSLSSSDYFLISSATTDYYVWFNIGGTGVDPAIGGRTGVRVDLAWDSSASTVASAIAAALPAGQFTASAIGSTITVTNRQGGNVTDIADGNVGGAFSVGVTSQGTNSTLANGDYFLISSATTDYYVWFNIGGTGVNPNIGGRTGIQVNINWGDSASAIAAAIATALPSSQFGASAVGSTVTVTNREAGNVIDIADGNIGGSFSVSTATQGINSPFRNGDHFFINSPTTGYYVWFNIGGAGVDPAIGGRTGIRVDVNWGESANSVATKLAAALNGAVFSAGAAGSTVTVTNQAAGTAADATDQNVGSPFAISTTTQGTSSTISNGSYFTVDTPSTDYYVWFNIGGTGVDPLVAGRTGVQINVNYGDSATTVAAAVAAALNPLGPVNATSSGSTVTISNTAVGVGSVGAGTLAGFTSVDIQIGTAAPITSGQYFLLSSSTTDYYVWYNVDGAMGDPGVAGRTGIRVDINTGASAATIAAQTRAAIGAVGPFTTGGSGGTVTVTVTARAPVTNASNVNVGGATVTVTQQGTAPGVDLVADTVSALRHGYTTGKAVQLATNGTLPGGLSTGTTYYLIAVDADTLKFATSLANALANVAIDLTSFGTGTHNIIASGSSVGAGVFISNGDGTLQAPTAVPLGPISTSVVFADMNQDGILDLINSESFNSVVEVSLGRGDGTFESYVDYRTGTGPSRARVEDVNRDGYLDVITSDYNNGTGSTISVLLGNGDGTLRAAVSFQTGTGPRAITLEDLNGDGILDVFTANSQAGTGTTASILFGNGDGTFQAARSTLTGTGPSGIAVLDVNRDGTRDIITSNATSGNITVSLGQSTSSTAMPYLNLHTQEDARESLTLVTAALERTLGELGAVGAQISRLGFAADFAETYAAEMEAAYGRFINVDMAEEMSKLIAAEIRMNAVQAVLAQMRLDGQVVMQLLKT